nr:hypothetical protein [Streptomyces solincola]
MSRRGALGSGANGVDPRFLGLHFRDHRGFFCGRFGGAFLVLGRCLKEGLHVLLAFALGKGADADGSLGIGREYDRAGFEELDFLDGSLEGAAVARFVQQLQELAAVADTLSVAVGPLVADYLEAEAHAADGAGFDRLPDGLDHRVVEESGGDEQALSVLGKRFDLADGDRARAYVVAVVELEHRRALADGLLEGARSDSLAELSFPRVDFGVRVENRCVAFERSAVACFAGAFGLANRREVHGPQAEPVGWVGHFNSLAGMQKGPAPEGAGPRSGWSVSRR